MKVSKWPTVCQWSALAMALLTLSMSARAQMYEPEKPKYWSIKPISAFIPTHGSVRNQATGSWWSVGLAYHPHPSYRPLNGDISISADFHWRDHRNKLFFSLPVTVNLTWPLTPEESPVRVYGGAGIGAALINTRFIGGTTEAAGKFIFGVDLSETTFFEVNYDWISGFTDSRGNAMRLEGVTFSLGMRF